LNFNIEITPTASSVTDKVWAQVRLMAEPTARSDYQSSILMLTTSKLRRDGNWRICCDLYIVLGLFGGHHAMLVGG